MPFRYLRDPLFVLCITLYFVNRIFLKPYFNQGSIGAFLHGSLNDLICIPFWVTIMVWLMHKTGGRETSAPPQGLEILLPLVLWSWLFETVLPQTTYFQRLATSDPQDILCYTIGALVASVFWKYYYPEAQK